MRNPGKSTRVGDYYILWAAVQKSLGVVDGPTLEPDLFAETYDVQKIPKDPVDAERIQEVLDYKSIREAFFPAGDTFREQMESLLPGDLLSGEPAVKNALAHLLGRLVVEVPDNLPDGGHITGLDFLSNALFHLHYLAYLPEPPTPIRWLHALQPKEGDRAGTQRLGSSWNLRTIRMDGAVNIRYDWVLQLFRNRLRMLLYEPIRRMTSEYNRRNRPIIIRRNDIMNTLGLTRRRAEKAYEYLQLLISERFIPSLQSLGLRYRCILGADERVPRPLGSLCEHISLTDAHYAGLDIYVEPKDASRSELDEELAIVADREIVSLRMDLFRRLKDGEEEGIWQDLKESDSRPETTRDWLLKESCSSRQSRKLSQDERNMLSILWAHQGSPEQRRQLIEIMEFPKRRRIEAFNELTNSKAFTVMYHPSLEYCGIPHGLMIAARASTSRKRSEMKDWLLSSFPFVRLLLGEQGQLAIVRRRTGGAQFAAQVVARQLSEMDIEHTTAVCSMQRTFYFTVLGRLYSDDEGRWRNPWLDS